MWFVCPYGDAETGVSNSSSVAIRSVGHNESLNAQSQKRRRRRWKALTSNRGPAPYFIAGRRPRSRDPSTPLGAITLVQPPASQASVANSSEQQPNCLRALVPSSVQIDSLKSGQLSHDQVCACHRQLSGIELIWQQATTNLQAETE